MTNRKIRHAQFNLQMQAVIEDNWRFLAGICLALEQEYGWRRQRLEGWVSSATEYVNAFNEHDQDGRYREKLEKLEKEQGGGIITRQRVEHIVISCTTLKRAFEIGEIVDNVLLELLMTAAEFDRVGRERLMSRFESFCKDDFSKAPGRLAKEYGIEVEQGFDDYWGLMKQRKGRAEKPTFKEEREAAKALEAFRRWSADNNPGEGEIMNNE